jgi:multidrug transporter EmrE-like cation transporter
VRLVSYLAAYTLLSTAGLLLLRRALGENRIAGESLVERILTPGVVVGGALYTASFGVWLLALARHPVTTVYPIFIGASFVGVLLGGWLILGERLDAIRVVGAVVVFVGIVLLAR